MTHKLRREVSGGIVRISKTIRMYCAEGGLPVGVQPSLRGDISSVPASRRHDSLVVSGTNGDEAYRIWEQEDGQFRVDDVELGDTGVHRAPTLVRAVAWAMDQCDAEQGLDSWSRIIARVGEQRARRDEEELAYWKSTVAEFTPADLTNQQLLDAAFGGIPYGHHDPRITEQYEELRRLVRCEIAARMRPDARG